RGGYTRRSPPASAARVLVLVAPLALPRGPNHARAPTAPSRAGAREGAAGAPADPDGRAGLLHRLGIERDAGELREPPLERRGRVAPERAYDVDRLAHAGAPLAVRHAADLELLRILAADADAEDQPAAGQRIEGRGDLRRDGGRPQGEQVDGGAEAHAARDRHVA